MYFTAPFVATLALILGGTSAAPADVCDPLQGVQAAEFSSWITDCGDTTGHTTGIWQTWRSMNKFCFPLPEYTRALDLHKIDEGCRITAFRGRMCSDYPENGTWRNTTGCLFTGNTEYRSYMLTCDE